jgi:hypothetical protein
MTTTSPAVDDPAHAGLRKWARGMYPSEAAVELLIRTGLAGAGRPWVDTTSDVARVDPDALDRHTGVLSGGQRRIAAVALSLMEGTCVDLGDVMTGVDAVHRYLILVALAYAGGDRTAWATARS